MSLGGRGQSLRRLGRSEGRGEQGWSVRPHASRECHHAGVWPSRRGTWRTIKSLGRRRPAKGHVYMREHWAIESPIRRSGGRYLLRHGGRAWFESHSSPGRSTAYGIRILHIALAGCGNPANEQWLTMSENGVGFHQCSGFSLNAHRERV